jgi:hypothetical protein
MWLVGIAALMGFAVGAIVVVGRLRPEGPKIPVWDIPRTAATNTTIVGSLSGFAVASSIFIANLRINQDDRAFEPVIGLFLTGFVTLVGTAMMFGMVPNHPQVDGAADKHGSVQHIDFTLATIGYYIGLAAIWMGLRPLLIALDMPHVADIFTWILLFVAVSGASRSAIHVYRFSRFGRHIIAAVPLIALGLTAIYRLVLVPAVPQLWPSGDAPLGMVLIAFVVGASGFVVSNLLIAGMSAAELSTKSVARRHLGLLAHAQIAACAVTLLWWAVAIG